MAPRIVAPPPEGYVRVRMTVAYDGSGFHGFASNPDVRTVQDDIEAVLAKVLREPITTTCAGRTDRGVHAPIRAAGTRRRDRLAQHLGEHRLDVVLHGADVGVAGEAVEPRPVVGHRHPDAHVPLGRWSDDPGSHRVRLEPVSYTHLRAHET